MGIPEAYEKMIAALKRVGDVRLAIDNSRLQYYQATYEVQKERNLIMKEILAEIKLLRVTGQG